MTTKKIFALSICITILWCLCGCENRYRGKGERRNRITGDIVYIIEDGKEVPYIVVDNNYNGNILLLRKNILNDTQVFNLFGAENSSYYADSKLRDWLENQFANKIEADIVPVELEVTTKDSVGYENAATEKIESKVFILSANEVCYPERHAFLKEGVRLEYFKAMDKTRIAVNDDGILDSWWLRTPDISKNAVVYAVSPDGVVSSLGVYGIDGETSIGVRPAFCIKQNSEIEEKDGKLFLIRDKK